MTSPLATLRARAAPQPAPNLRPLSVWLFRPREARPWRATREPAGGPGSTLCGLSGRIRRGGAEQLTAPESLLQAPREGPILG